MEDDSSILVASLRILIRETDELLNKNITKVVVDKYDSALYFSKAPVPWDRDSWAENIVPMSSLSFPIWFKEFWRGPLGMLHFLLVVKAFPGGPGSPFAIPKRGPGPNMSEFL